MSPTAPLILVVGMHRSGTSLLGSLLPALGVPLPGPLIGADQHNPEGYFERQDVTDLQEQLLIDLGRWWPSAPGVLPLPEAWLEARCTLHAAERLRCLLAAEAARQAGPWGIKDPRTSLLIPLWRQVADQLGLSLRLVLSVRDPAEVMLSLLQRDRNAAGMTAPRAQQLWWRHTRQVLLDGEGLPIQTIHYDTWFEPGLARQQLLQLADFCGLCPPPAPLQEVALRHIRPEHRRSLPKQTLPLPIHSRLHWLNRELRRNSRLAPIAALRHRTRLSRRLAAVPPESIAPHAPLLARLKSRLRAHPWQPAALACAVGDPEYATALLQGWLEQGLSSEDLIRIQQAAVSLFPRRQLQDARRPRWPKRCYLRGFGTHLGDWKLHAWLQHCPLPRRFELIEPEPGQHPPDPARSIGFHFQAVAESAASRRLLELAELALVLDPDPSRVDLLRRLGIRAHWLQARPAHCSDWLGRSDDLAAATTELNLPAPASLQAITSLESARIHTIHLGRPQGHLISGRIPPMYSLEQFDALSDLNPRLARSLASWLTAVGQHGVGLVRLQPTMAETEARVEQALAPHWLPLPQQADAIAGAHS